jgi:hypothetical protein
MKTPLVRGGQGRTDWEVEAMASGCGFVLVVSAIAWAAVAAVWRFL